MRYLQLIALVVFANTLYGQHLTVSWSTDSCQIGEQVQLRLRLTHAPKQVVYRPLEGEVSCGLIIDSSSLTQKGTMELLQFSDSTFSRKGVRTWEGTYTVTAWDTGIYQFPLLRVVLKDSTYEAVPPSITVSFVKKHVDDEIDEVPVEPFTDRWWWFKKYWWLVFIPVLAIVILLVRKRNSVKRFRELSLKQRTMIAFEALKKQAFWKKDRINEHYIEFSFLLRSFLSARYELNLMERTTVETLLLLKAKGIPEDTLQRIRQLLQESDMVKFAQNTPDEPTILLSLTRMEELIVELSPLELIE